MAFVRIVASCFIVMGSAAAAAALDWPRSTWRVRNIKYTKTNTSLILCLVGSLTLCLTLPCGAGIYLVMGFSGNSFQLFDLLLIPHAPPPSPSLRSSHAYHHSNWKHCQFSNSPRLPIPLLPLFRSFAKRENASTETSIIILCAAWIYKRSNYERIGRENGLIMENCEIDRSCVDSKNHRHALSLSPFERGR